jgi:uncharacterized iron-regulated membrane protein
MDLATVAAPAAARSAARARTWWLRLHRWLAWTLGLPLVLVALLGALLVVLKPLDRWWNAPLFRVAAAPPVPGLLESTRVLLTREFSGQAALTFRPPRIAGDSLWVIVRGPAWQGTVYVDPASGRELGRRGEHEGLYNLAFELHSSLLLDEAGKPLLAVVAAAYAVLLAGGLVLWWPKRWKNAWPLVLNRGPQRALFDLHRLAGSLLGLAIAVPVATGAYMAWRPLSAAVTAVAGDTPRAPPKVPPTVKAVDATIPRAPLDEIAARAQVRFAGAPIGYLQVPATVSRDGTPERPRPLRVRLMLPDDPHPNGLTSVWMHPASGEVLAVQPWRTLDAGARAYTVIYPLHIGTLGGLAHEVLNALLGLALAALGACGWLLWWLRRRSAGGAAGPSRHQRA